MLFKVGDQVIVRKNIQDITPRIPYIVITSEMRKLEGHSGVITEIGRMFDEFKIAFHRVDNEISQRYLWASSWVINTSNMFKKGDRVQILQSIPDADQNTSIMHWREESNADLGRIGTITDIDSEGDLMLRLDGSPVQTRHWFCPLWVTPLKKSKKRTFAEIEVAVSAISALVTELEKTVNS